MAYSLEQILGYIPLTKMLRTHAGIPNPFPKQFFEVKEGGKIRGDKTQYIRVGTERRTAQVVPYNAPSKKRELLPIDSQSARLLYSSEHIKIDPNILLKLREFGSYSQEEGRDWLNYQIKENGKRLGNSRLVSLATTLRFGEIYIDASGNVLPDSSGAAHTYSFNVPATHKTTINGIVSSSWALPNTDIPGQLRELYNFAVEETGMEPKTVLYGKNIPKYLMQNVYVKEHFVRYQSMNQNFLETNQIPNGLLGYNWVYVGHAFVQKDDGTTPTNGTNVKLWDDDLCVFLPDLNQPEEMDGWYQLFEGSIMVPKRLSITQGGEDVLNNFTEVTGQFSYGHITIAPASAQVEYGDIWLPALRNEKAIYMMDTVP